MNQAILTALAAVGGFVGKSVWDLYWTRREQIASLARQKRIDLLERQLSLFYWPLYLQLQMNNVVWEHLLHGTAMEESIKQTVNHQLHRSFFSPNHDGIVKLIESNIHLAQPDADLEALLLKFIRHVTIFKALRDAGREDVDPIAVGEPWPADLFPAVERKLRALQSAYSAEISYRAAPKS